MNIGVILVLGLKVGRSAMRACARQRAAEYLQEEVVSSPFVGAALVARGPQEECQMRRSVVLQKNRSCG